MLMQKIMLLCGLFLIIWSDFMVNQWQIDTLKEGEKIVFNKKVPFKTRLKRLFKDNVYVTVPYNGKSKKLNAEDVAIVRAKDLTTIQYSCKVYVGKIEYDCDVFTNTFSTTFAVPSKNISFTIETGLIKDLYREILKREDGFYDEK